MLVALLAGLSAAFVPRRPGHLYSSLEGRAVARIEFDPPEQPWRWKN